jgi:hypothetical protein
MDKTPVDGEETCSTYITRRVGQITPTPAVFASRPPFTNSANSKYHIPLRRHLMPWQSNSEKRRTPLHQGAFKVGHQRHLGPT